MLLYMFVEVDHGNNNGDFWGHQKKVIAAHQAGKGYKIISKKLILYKWRKFKSI